MTMDGNHRFRFLLIATVLLLHVACLSARAEEGSKEKPVVPALIKNFAIPGRASSLAFDSTSTKLITGGWGAKGMDSMPDWRAGTCPGDVRVWDIASGRQLAHFGDDVGGVFQVLISPDDRLIVT